MPKYRITAEIDDWKLLPEIIEADSASEAAAEAEDLMRIQLDVVAVYTTAELIEDEDE